MTQFRCQTCNEEATVPDDHEDPPVGCSGGHFKARKPRIGTYVIEGDTRILDVNFGDGWRPLNPDP